MIVKTNPTPTPNPSDVSLLILGAGWTSTFLIPLLKRKGVDFAATTTDGRNGTIPFRFDPASDDTAPFAALPTAKTVLITFPLKGTGPAARLVRAYAATHPDAGGVGVGVGEGSGSGSGSGSSESGGSGQQPLYIQLGVTSIWTAGGWQDENSPYDTSNPRAVAEDELLRCAPAGAAVLSLAGLYGADRQPRDWVRRVVRSKEDLRAKGALHVVHGEDVARAILALHWKPTPGKRWILCDMHVYDWWDLVQDWAVQTLMTATAPGAVVDIEEITRHNDLLKWVGELMVEEDVKALPRDSEAVGRRLDGRGFWHYMGIWPSQGRIR
ncbi:hypothetical protein GGR51DRAFT_505684 [Nemania sp. FL0031]|nr:hypothetical protein GGR51DRAFT_505684 [Nemania sp. FL0031]